MSNEHNFTMNSSQKKRYYAEQHNQKYDAAKLKAKLNAVHEFGSLIDQLGIKAKIDPQDLPDSVEITPVVPSAREELQAVGRSQRDDAERRVVVLGSGSAHLGGNVAQRLAFASPVVLADIGKQQAREEICQLLIDEGSQEKFVDYMATLTGITWADIPLRKLKLPKLNELDPKEIMTYAHMYEDAVREARGLPKRAGAPDLIELLNKGQRLVDVYSEGRALAGELGFTAPGRGAKRMLTQMALTKAVEIIQEQKDDQSR